MSSWLGSGPLIGERVTLRPLRFDDVEALSKVVGDPSRFRWVPGVPVDAVSARSFVEAALHDPERRVGFAVIDNETGTLVGSTSYYDIDAANLTCAIGYTFYTEAAQGTTINPTAKYLLMKHAFEDCGAVRLVWHTHENNAQSRAAITKLGATFEGLLRKHRRFGDGWRTTAQFAMVDEDWPAAKETLLQRLP
ncbi:GNAT family protein [Gordonia sp. NPDC003585]|uniref:GNAT family N-acetyltransferase n=1 Tax=unclassified Gordonia (in: high G+C Gram-positive bacteria) TaxID=2657482 RepID=UPI0033A69BD5